MTQTGRRRDLDLLAIGAMLIALLLMPFLGIGHPATHALVLLVMAMYAWRLKGSGTIAQRLDLAAPGAGGWLWIGLGGVLTGALRLILDDRFLGGRGGIGFYRQLFRQYGVLDGPTGPRWEVLAAYAPVLLAVILIDGIFFSGLIQRRIAAHTNVHAGVLGQAVLFAVPHAFAGARPDPVYGAGTLLAGIAYGYVYAHYGNHWRPAFLLWTHVMSVWVMMLAGTA